MPLEIGAFFFKNMEEKQLEFARTLYGKYGINDEEKIKYAAESLSQDFEGTLSAFYGKYNPEKEIDWGYFNQVKQDYFQPVAMEEVVPLEEAPSGFFANMKNHLDNLPETVANSFWGGLNFIDRNIDNAFDVAVEGLTGIPQSAESGNSEFFLNRIKQNEQSILPTKGILEEGATIPERLSGVAGVTIDFARSIVSGAISGGAIPIIEQVDGMYRSALEEKAKLTGKNPLQLMIDNEDEELEPLLYGAVAAGLERVGLKGVGKYINALPKDAKSNAIKFLYTNTKEGGTEWLQGWAEKMNESTAQGNDISTAFKDGFKYGFSREGAETFVGGFLGAAGIGAAGRGIKKALTPAVDKTEESVDASLQTPDQIVSEQMQTDAPVIEAMQTVESGDPDIDQLVTNVLRETEQELESKRLEEATSKKQEEVPQSAPPAQEVVAPDGTTTPALPVDPKKEKEEVKKEEAKLAVDSGVAKELSRTIRDKESLKKALYSFIGVSETDKDAVDEVNTYASFFDGVIGARAKREGISKREWYLSRFASVGNKPSEANKSETTFLEDGRAIIVALGKADARSFFQEFSKVIQKDLNETEASALEAEFGINFKSDLSEESFKQFATAFESYVETGAIPAKIQGNTAQFVRAAFGKIAQWMRDIKSSISGDSSIYVNSNIRKVFDAIVTGKDIEAIHDRDVNNTILPKDEVIDLTETQEEVIDKPIITDEQKTEKISKPVVPTAPKKQGAKPQIDPATEKRDAFRESQKSFEVSPTGAIKGGPVSLKKAIEKMQSLATSPNQDELTKEEARREVMRLMEIEANANKVKSSVDERNKNLSKIKEDVTKAGYDVKGLNEVFANKANVPLEYNDGYVAYIDVTTGEVQEYSLYKKKSTATTLAKFQSPESSDKRKAEVKERAVKIAESELEKKEKERIEKQSKDEVLKRDKEADKINSADDIIENKEDSAKNVSKVIDLLESADSNLAFSSSIDSRDEDVSKNEISSSVVKYLKKYLNKLDSVLTSRDYYEAKKSLEATKESILRFAKNSPLLSEEQRSEIIEKVNSVLSSFAVLDERYEAEKKESLLNKIIGGVRNTVLDKSKDVKVQLEGFSDKEIGDKLSGMFKDLMRGFGLSKKLIVIDAAYFTSDKHPDFKGKTREEIIELRNKKIDRISALKASQKLKDSKDNFISFSFDTVRNSMVSSINRTITGTSLGSYSQGDQFDVIIIDSSRPEYVRTATHEFGHFLEMNLVESLDTDTKIALNEAYKEWISSKYMQVAKSGKIVVPTFFSKGGSTNDSNINYYIGSFSEFFAEQVSFWVNTAQKPSSVIEKFFADVAKALKELFIRYKEEFIVSETVDKFLNDQFSLDGRKSTEKQKEDRDKAISNASSEYEDIIANQRKIDDIKLKIPTKPSAPAKATSEELALIVKEFFTEKKKSLARIASLEAENKEKEAKIEADYESYVENGGTGDYQYFRKRVNSLGEDRFVKALERLVNSSISTSESSSKEGNATEEDSDNYTASTPAVSFNQTANPRSGSKREIFIDKISTAIDGKFKTTKEFIALIKSINKSLKASGELPITLLESKKILSKTESGSIARISSPIYRLIRETGATKELIDVIASFSASRKERDDALAAADTMVKSGNPLTEDELHEFNKLQLVGLYNTTIAERESLGKDKVGRAIAKREQSMITHRVEERRNSDRIRVAESIYSSVFGFQEISKGVYRFLIDGLNGSKSFVANIYDRRNTYKKDDIVEYGGNLYKVTELIDSFDTGFLKSMEKIGSINKHQTKAELHKKPWFKAFQEKVSNFNLSVQGIESIASIVSRMDKEGAFEGRLSEMLGEEGFRKAARAQRKHRIEVEKKYIGLGERIFGVNGATAVNKILYKKRAEVLNIKFKDNNGNDVSVKMTRGEAMSWYAYLGQEDLVAKFKSMEETYKSMPSDARYWSKAKQDAIIDALSDKDKAFVSGVITDVLPYVYDILNTAHRRELGYDMQLIKNYFPTKVETTNTNSAQMSTLDTETLNYSNFISSIGNNNIKERRSSSPLKVDDFFAQFLQYSEKAIHYAEYVGPLRRASLLFQNQKYEYSGYFNSVFGRELMSQIKNNLDNIAFGAPAHFARNKLADTLRSLGIGGAFMANTTLFFKQAASFVAMASDMSWRDFSKYYITTDWKGRLSDIQEILAMDFTKERIAQHGKVSYDTYGLMFDSLEKALNKSELEMKGEAAMAMINKVLFFPVMGGDIAAVLMGGAPYLRSLKEKAKIKFPNDAERQKEWVEIKFEEKVSRTQQSRDIMDQSSVQTAGSWASWFTTFMSTPILYGRLLSGSIRDVNKGLKTGNKELTKKGLKTGIMFSVIAPLFFQVASTGGTLVLDSLGFGDDEEEDQITAWKYNTAQIAAAFVQHVPLVYQTVQYFIDRFARDSNFDLAISAPEQIYSRGGEAVGDIIDQLVRDDFDMSNKDTQRSMNDALRMVGINYNGVKNLSSNWYELFTEGEVEDYRLLLGYSPYAIK